jgi:CRP/FNR family transcriptional regulator
MHVLKDFFNLKNSEIEHILSFSHAVSYKKGEILFYDGEIMNQFHFLSKGTVIAYQVDNDYKKIVWHIFNAPCFIGEGVLLQDNPKPTVFTTEWLCDGEVIKIDFKKFELHYMNRSDVLYKMLKSICSKMSNYRHFVLNEKFFNSTEKVAFFIVNQADLVEYLKLGEISSILNIQQPTLSKILKHFREEGLIEDVKFKIIIKDKNRLQELCKSKF